MQLTRWGPILVVAAFAVAGCGSDDAPTAVSASRDSSGAPPTSAPVTSAVPAPATTAAPTTAAPATTAAPTTTAPTTTAAPTTLAPLTADDLDLAATEIGPVAFGTGVEPTLAVLTPVLGAPATDESAEYPFADEVNGGYLDDADGFFAFPLLRRVCFANGLCIAFGGRSVDDLQLVGYEYFTAEAPVPPVLATTTGVPLGGRWSDHLDAMTVQAGGCYSQGFGAADGVELYLQSSGVLFGAFEGESYIESIPDPADVTVYGMLSGENPGYLYADC
jgi:hypothetical protein